MSSTLFSTYATGENRVTATTLAVFERIDLNLVKSILATASGAGDELGGVNFRNQVVGKGHVPDGVISANFSWMFETKTVRGQYDSEGHSRSQLRAHAASIEGKPQEYLFVLTPDTERPPWFDSLDGVSEDAAARTNWLSFGLIADAIEQIFDGSDTTATEHVRFLLRELIDFYEAEGLLSSDDTVVVAARWAWQVYEGQHVNGYFFQPNRAFKRDAQFLGFYSDGKIMATVPRIVQRYNGVSVTHESADSLSEDDRALADLIHAAVDRRSVEEGATVDLFLLTGPDDPETVHLEAPIQNDTKTATGRGWAWTLGQRYTRIKSLQKPGLTKTSQIE